MTMGSLFLLRCLSYCLSFSPHVSFSVPFFPPRPPLFLIPPFNFCLSSLSLPLSPRFVVVVVHLYLEVMYFFKCTALSLPGSVQTPSLPSENLLFDPYAHPVQRVGSLSIAFP